MGFNQAPALPYRNLGIVEDGDTASQAIEKDKYIIWKGQNYFAKTDILQGETFVVDTNLTAMPEGVINGIVDTLNASLETYDVLLSGNTTGTKSLSQNISNYKMLLFTMNVNTDPGYTERIFGTEMIPVGLLQQNIIFDVYRLTPDSGPVQFTVRYVSDTQINVQYANNLVNYKIYGIK